MTALALGTSVGNAAIAAHDVAAILDFDRCARAPFESPCFGCRSGSLSQEFGISGQKQFCGIKFLRIRNDECRPFEILFCVQRHLGCAASNHDFRVGAPARDRPNELATLAFGMLGDAAAVHHINICRFSERHNGKPGASERFQNRLRLVLVDSATQRRESSLRHLRNGTATLCARGSYIYYMSRVVLTGLTADSFVTEADRKALAALERVPLLPQVLRKFSELGLDRWLYCMNMAMSVRCGPKQYSSLHSILKESCAVLDMPEPELYVASNPFPNAFAGGVERNYVVIRSAMIDTLADEQLYHLIGHELGHIKSGHMLYKMVGRFLVPLLQAMGRRLPIVGDAAAIGLLFAFYEWFRQAELSCDRAGLLVSQDLKTSLEANLALTAGPNRFRDEQSLDAFMDQARVYQEAAPLDKLGKVILFFTTTWTFSHPMPVARAQHLERWHKSGEYDSILKGKTKAPKKIT